MGRFTFTLLLCAATGCIDHAVVDDGAPTDDPEIMGNVMDDGGVAVTPRLGITSCGVTNVATGNVATSLAITQTGRGSSMMFGTRQGELVGYRFESGVLASDPAGFPIAIDAKVKTTSTTRLDGQTVVASAGDGEVVVDLVADNLRDVRHLATLSGTAVSEDPMITAPGGYLLPMLDTDGIHLDHFDRNWRMTSETVITTALVPEGISAALVGTNSMVAWSANNECHLQYANAGVESDGSYLRQACASPHLAVNPVSGEALVAYDSPNGVTVIRAPYAQLKAPKLVRHNTSTPQVAFDGQRFWLSFLDERGQIILGFFDDQSRFTSATIPGMSPEHGNYRLQILDGQAAIVSTSSSGYSVQRMCTRTL